MLDPDLSQLVFALRVCLLSKRAGVYRFEPAAEAKQLLGPLCDRCLPGSYWRGLSVLGVPDWVFVPLSNRAHGSQLRTQFGR